MTLSLSACGKSKKDKYQSYVNSLIAINYLGAADEYIKSTGANKEDAIALYEQNIDVLTESIYLYYGIAINADSELAAKYRDLSKNIYSKIDYSVSKSYESDGTTKLDVTIKPIYLFEQTKEEVVGYIDNFNTRVANGEFNDYTIDMYNEKFAEGLYKILNDACNNMQYDNEKTVTVSIIKNDNIYYISNDDFLAIDAAMISTASTSPVNSATDANP